MKPFIATNLNIVPSTYRNKLFDSKFIRKGFPKWGSFNYCEDFDYYWIIDTNIFIYNNITTNFKNYYFYCISVDPYNEAKTGHTIFCIGQAIENSIIKDNISKELLIELDRLNII